MAKQGRAAEAESAYKRAISALETLPDAHFQLGLLFESQHRFAESERAFTRAAELRPDSAEIQVGLGVVFERQERYANAEAACRRAIELDPELPEAHLDLGVSLERQHHYREAESAYREAIRLRPSLQQARVSLAAVLEQQGRVCEAEEAYRAAVATAPDDPYARLGLGLLLAKQRRHREAEASYREALGIRPGLRAAHSALGLALYMTGRAQEAVDEYRQAISLPVDSDLIGYLGEWDQYKLAQTLTFMRRDKEAEVAFLAALALRPEFPEALIGLADLLTRDGKPEQAEEYARRAVAGPSEAWRLPSEAWKALGTLAGVCVELGEKFHDDEQFEEALAELTSAQRAMPGQLSDQDREPAALLDLLRGYALARLGRFGEARSVFRRCTKQAAPNSAVALAAVRNERRLSARLRNRADVPRWVPYVLSAAVLAAIAYSVWLVERNRLQPAEFLSAVAVAVLLVFAAFSLPALTRLRVGPAELQKETSFAPAPRLELLVSIRGLAGMSTPALVPDMSPSRTLTVAVFAQAGVEVKLPLTHVLGEISISPPQLKDPRNLRGKTEHFDVYVDPALGAGGQQVADTVLAKCEADYATIATYFGGIAAGPFSVILFSNPAGAYHTGCAATDFYCDTRTDPVDGDFSEFLNVSMFVEVFESVHGKGWNCGHGNGEGLSRVLGTALYPAKLDGFATAHFWLDSKRPNYVDRNYSTDTNAVANGCAVLFLNWLRFQLGYSWEQIVAAAGANLGQTYAKLTGRQDGFRQFKSLIDGHFPASTPSGLITDNPFPLPPLIGKSSSAG